MNDFVKPQLRTRETPVQILSEDFPRHQWPISGGWGYSQEDAVVIEVENGSVGVSLEYKILEYRTYEELIIFKPKGEKYAGFRFEHGMQYLIHGDNGKSYDHITMKVTCMKEEDWERLKKAWMEHNAYEGDPDGREAHLKLHEEKLVTFETDGWFDITKFFGNEVAFRASVEQ